MSRFLVILVVLSPTSAFAWECIDDSCPTVCAPPLRYQIGEVPPGLDEAMVISEVQRAFATWEATDCASITFEYTGRVGDGGSGVELAWTEEWTGDASQWATPGVSWSADGCIAESRPTSFEANARDFEWGLSPASGSMVLDVYSVTLKAVGNFIGLGNSRDSEAVMYFATTGDTRTTGLGSDDIDGACTLYGDRVPPDAGAGSGLACSPCESNADCDSNLCIGFPDGVQLCGAVCETSADCEDGAECTMTAGAASLCTRGEGTDLMCALNATDGDSGVDRDAGTATDAALDAGSGGGGGCSVGASTSAAWLFSFLLLRRRKQR